MKPVWAFTLLIFGALRTVGFGLSMDIEITPERPEGFKELHVLSKRLDNGDIEFSIAISHKPPTVHYTTKLCAMRNAEWAPGKNIGCEFLRAIPSEENETEIKSVFTVTLAELKDPDLSFSLTNKIESPGAWGFHHHFVRLRKYLPP